MSETAVTGKAAFSVVGPVGRLSGSITRPQRTGDGGAEAPTIVFVHGVNMDRRVWADVIEALPDARRISFDLRGHGASVPAGPFTVDDYVGDLAAVTATWGADSVHLAGVSLGGMVACRFAQLHPTRVASVLTFGSGLSVRHVDLDGGMARLAQVGVVDYFGTSLRRNSLPQDVSAALADTALAMATEGRAELTEMVIELTRAAFSTDLTGVLDTLEAPTLVVNGSDDRTCSPIAGAQLGQAVGGKLREIEGTGHVLPLERPALCAELVSAMIHTTQMP